MSSLPRRASTSLDRPSLARPSLDEPRRASIDQPRRALRLDRPSLDAPSSIEPVSTSPAKRLFAKRLAYRSSQPRTCCIVQPASTPHDGKAQRAPKTAIGIFSCACPVSWPVLATGAQDQLSWRDQLNRPRSARLGPRSAKPAKISSTWPMSFSPARGPLLFHLSVQNEFLACTGCSFGLSERAK